MLDDKSDKPKMLKKNAALAVVVAVSLSVVGGQAKSQEPSFEPFFASRMWEVAFGQMAPSLVTEKLVAELNELNAALESDELENESLENLGHNLNPSLSPAEQSVWQLMPFVMLQLCSLPNDGNWNSLETQVATVALKIASRVEPQLEEYDGVVLSENNASVQTQACNQFAMRAFEPQYLGYMIFTLDDGPWAPSELDGECEPTEEKAVTDQFTIRICKQQSGGWGIEGISSGELIWRQAVPMSQNSHLNVTDMHLVELGEYGWRINILLGELVHFYVDRDFSPMFYFTSW